MSEETVCNCFIGSAAIKISPMRYTSRTCFENKVRLIMLILLYYSLKSYGFKYIEIENLPERNLLLYENDETWNCEIKELKNNGGGSIYFIPAS